jgi:DNA-binding beta-propeller fold protein YncE
VSFSRTTHSTGRRRVPPALSALPVLIALVALTPAAAATPETSPGQGQEQEIVEQGIAVRMTLTPRGVGGGAGAPALREEEDVNFAFHFSDTASGRPLTGLNPAAWLDLLPEGEPAGGAGCIRRIKELLAGSLFSQPRLDLSAFFVLALNEDASVSVVDPHFGFGGSKLLAMVPLLSPGADWALSADQGTLYVSEPAAGRVAVVRTDVWKVTAQIDVGGGGNVGNVGNAGDIGDVGGHPGRIALQPDGGYLWVALEPGVAVVDTRTLQVVARPMVGKGRHEMAFSDDSAFAFITNADDGTATVVGVPALAAVATLKTGERPAAVAWSQLARAAYVTDEGDGSIAAIDPRRRAVVARVAARPGLGQIRFAPGGRLGFVVNPQANSVQVLDTATNRILQTGEVASHPDQINFSDDLAYIRTRGSDTVLMVPLREIGEAGKPLPVADFTGGQHALGETSNPSLAASIVAAPGGGAVLVANPLDHAIYYYREGMAAPMGTFQNYGRQPRAVLVVDRSLGEKTRPGTYETVARLPTPAGRYRMALFLDSPRVAHCFAVDVAPDPGLAARQREAAPTKVEPVEAGAEGKAPAVAGRPAHFRFRLLDSATGVPRAGVRDLVVLVYPISGVWQHRETATELAGGIYEATFVLPQPGTYAAVVASASQKLPFHLSPQLLLQVVDKGGVAAP